MWFTIVFIYIVYVQVHIAGEVGDDCIPNEQISDGTCVPVLRCEVALRAIQESDDKNHPFQRCGFEGLTEIVCCPTNKKSETKYGEDTSTTGYKTGEKSQPRVADKECQKIIESGKDLLSLYIIGGDDASPGEFPHMVALGYPNGYGYTFDCGGSLISETYILTAAHCVSKRIDNPPSIARLGTLVVSDEEFNNNTDVRIAEIKLHPSRKPSTKYHDLALLRLEKPVKSNELVNPICLYTSQEDPRVSLTVTGWGQTSVSSRAKNITLQKADLSILDRVECGESYKISNMYWLKLPNGIISEQICAHHPQGLTDTCQGDSGGPLQVMSSDRNYRLVGVTSFGPGCGSSKPGVYTKISSYLDWIESVVWPQ